MVKGSTAVAACACAVAVLALVGCGKDSSTTTAPSVTISAPSLVTPATGAQLADGTQPVTLVVANATSTGKNPLTYTFDVATDDQFTAKVYTKSGVAQGTGTQTSLQIDKLTASKGYFWRARAEDTTGAVAGPWSAVANFTIGIAIRIDPPALLEPIGGVDAGGARPMFTIQNSSRGNGAGVITYSFDISETSQFQVIVATGTAPESSSGQTIWWATKDLAAKPYFWRAKAVDASHSASSAYSDPQPFKAHPDEINPRTVVYFHGPDFSDWPITRTLLRVTQAERSVDEVCTYFTHQGDWPPVIFYDEPQTLVEGNQWYFANINNQWYGVPGEWFRPGVACKYGQAADGIGRDSTMDEPFHSWQPRPGELVGYAVSTPARNWPSMRSLDERSQIVLLPWR
jgi:hypothetical protein